MNKIAIWTLSIVSLGLVACGGKKEETPAEMEMHQQAMGETYVDTMTLHTSTFNKQIVCNGRLRAKAMSELNFVTQGVTATMKNVPQDVMKRAEVTSGYFSAQYQLQSAKKALEECNLYAPFSGRIANLEARPYQNNSKICTLIDDSQFEVEFKILKAEFKSVKKGRHVKVSPFVNDSLVFDGVITEINPMVDDKGLIKVMARLDNKSSELMDGMNVRIIVEEEIQDMYVVPKDAVVERDGYHVVFLYEEGQAVWTYVDVLHSNINSFAITGCQRKETTIHEGDIVITSGNLNLADGTEVKLN